MKILIHFYYDLGASTALLLRYCRFCYNSWRLTKISNLSRIAVHLNGWGGGVVTPMKPLVKIGFNLAEMVIR